MHALNSPLRRGGGGGGRIAASLPCVCPRPSILSFRLVSMTSPAIRQSRDLFASRGTISRPAMRCNAEIETRIGECSTCPRTATPCSDLELLGLYVICAEGCNPQKTNVRPFAVPHGAYAGEWLLLAVLTMGVSIIAALSVLSTRYWMCVCDVQYLQCRALCGVSADAHDAMCIPRRQHQNQFLPSVTRLAGGEGVQELRPSPPTCPN